MEYSMYSENFCKSDGHVTYVSLQNDGIYKPV